VRRARGEEAQIVAAGGLMIGGEPLDLVGALGPHVDLLAAEHERGARRLALARIEHLHLHAEDCPVPFGRARDVGDIDHEMIERMDLDRHALSFRRYACRAPLPHWPLSILLVTTRSANSSRTTKNRE